MGKFKVGDRVRFVMDYGHAKEGDEGTIVSFWADDGAVVTHKTVNHSCNLSRIELVPVASAEWQPKVGDKVRWREIFAAKMYTKDKVYEIRSGYGDRLYLTDDDLNAEYGKHQWSADLIVEHFDLVEPLTIIAGRYYKTRDGRKVGPAFIGGDVATFGTSDNWSSAVWANDGRQSSRTNKTTELANDIIAEWVDEPTAQPVVIANDNAAPAKFKVGDKIRHKGLGHTGHIESLVGNDCARTFWTSVGWGATDPFDDIELITTATTPAIVALIENGVGLPSTRPVVHASQEAATTEASRLALLHPGQEFGVFVLADSKIADVVEEVVKKTVLRPAA